MTSDKREQAIEHLLRGAHDGADPAGVCLDGETAAGWVEGRLTRAEVERVRLHAADCARCQALMASIGVATPPDAHAAREPGWRHWLRWAAPAAAGAVAVVAVAVWLNVRPAPAPEPATRSEVSETRRQAQPPNPAPPPAASAQQQAFADGRRPGADGAASNADKAPPVTPSRSVEPSIPAPAQADRLDRLESANAVTAGTVPIAPQATAPSADAKADAPALNPRVAATFEQSMARSFALREIVPPESTVRWRLAGDRVERSTDSGNSWTSATRLDTGAIIAGSAPGPLVCWLAGRAGIVFLATDGVTFRQVTPPVTADLVAVSAVDATSATVTAGDGRRFSTTNGGATWNPAAVR